MDSLWLAAGSALWLGILTSISPCPLATNVAAVSYVGRQVGKRRAVLGAGALYMAGRTLAYLILGAAAVWSLMSVVSVSMFLQNVLYRALGPLLIAVGLLLFGVLRFTLPGSGVSPEVQRRVDRLGLWGAGLIGFLFALSFCPVSAGLFFGILVPMAVDHGSAFVLPTAYGIGTAVPVAVFAVLLAGGAGRLGEALDRIQAFEVWARRATAVVFIAVGVYETLRTTLRIL